MRPGVSALIMTLTRELAIQIHPGVRHLGGRHRHPRAAVVVGGLNDRRNAAQTIRKGVARADRHSRTPRRFPSTAGWSSCKRGSAMLVLDEAGSHARHGLPAHHQEDPGSAVLGPADGVLLGHHRILGRAPDQHASQGSGAHRHRLHHQAGLGHIDLHVYEVEQDRKLGLLENMLQQERGSFLVFARTKHGADRLAKRLARSGSKAACIHGDRTQSQRNLALRGISGRQLSGAGGRPTSPPAGFTSRVSRT